MTAPQAQVDTPGYKETARGQSTYIWQLMESVYHLPSCFMYLNDLHLKAIVFALTTNFIFLHWSPTIYVVTRYLLVTWNMYIWNLYLKSSKKCRASEVQRCGNVTWRERRSRAAGAGRRGVLSWGNESRTGTHTQASRGLFLRPVFSFMFIFPYIGKAFPRTHQGFPPPGFFLYSAFP